MQACHKQAVTHCPLLPCRDHRRIGQDLDLFSLNDSAGAGLVFWHPKGALVRHLMETHWKQKHMEAGYQLIYTPHVASATLWQRSGHLDFYRENMFDQMQVCYLLTHVMLPGILSVAGNP